MIQGGLLAGILLLVALALTAQAPTFWPLVLVATVLPWLPLRGLPTLALGAPAAGRAACDDRANPRRLFR